MNSENSKASDPHRILINFPDKRDLYFKYSQKLLDHAKQSATNAFKTVSKRKV